MYVISYGTSTLFYKNGILSRRRPTTVNIAYSASIHNYKINKYVLLSFFSYQLKYILISDA